ncbi:TIGR00645 family protein [Labrys okinawensis]|uniref:TIGR00645 family protein n=1 Tax=Labrys okinawensis TaxID=346911 RepID=UPI0039BC3200
MEKLIERGLVASRWVMAPFYLGLVVALFVVLLKFCQELVHYIEGSWFISDEETVTGALQLVDLALLASLILIVIFSGYENFVSRIDGTDHDSWPSWMTQVDFSGLKLKMLASIVLISAIQLLKGFMQIEKLSDRDLYWLVGIHIVFMVSSVLLALSDWLQAKAGHGNN